MVPSIFGILYGKGGIPSYRSDESKAENGYDRQAAKGLEKQAAPFAAFSFAQKRNPFQLQEYDNKEKSSRKTRGDFFAFDPQRRKPDGSCRWFALSNLYKK